MNQSDNHEQHVVGVPLRSAYHNLKHKNVESSILSIFILYTPSFAYLSNSLYGKLIIGVLNLFSVVISSLLQNTEDIIKSSFFYQFNKGKLFSNHIMSSVNIRNDISFNEHDHEKYEKKN